MDATIIYDEVASLVGVNRSRHWSYTQILKEFASFADILSVLFNASLVLEASNMDGKR